MKNLLPKLLSYITGHRYVPEIQWASKSWTHNVFRLYEKVFGRKYGIRCEVSAYWEKGRVTYEFHTIEAALAHFEARIRGLVPKFSFEKVYIPQLAFSNGMKTPSPYLFAIAYDTSGIQSTASSTPTISLTLAGSDRLLILAPDNGSGGTSIITGTTWNTTEIGTFLTGVAFGGGNAETRQYYVNNPTSGTHNAAAAGLNSDIRLIASSYTGVNQSSPIDASTTQSNASTSSFVPAITTTQDNCYIVVSGQNNGGTATASVGTMRQAAGTGRMLGDNSAPTTGSNSMTMGGVGTASWGASVVSLAPVAAAGPANLKSLDTNVKANIKSYNTNVLANIKSINTNP